MKIINTATQKIVLATFLVFATLGCVDSIDSTSDMALTKSELSEVLSKSNSFTHLVSSMLGYLSELEINYNSLSQVQKDKLAEISQRVSGYPDLRTKITSYESNLFLELTPKSVLLITRHYQELITEIRSFKFSQDDLQNLIAENVAKLKIKKYDNASLAKCQNACSNLAEEVYWTTYNQHGNSDASATMANLVYSSCSYGCRAAQQ